MQRPIPWRSASPRRRATAAEAREKGLVKTLGFGEGKYVGDPINAVRIFNEKQVDELVICDIDATVKSTGVNYTLIAPSGGFLRTSLGESFHIAGENSYLVGSGLNGTSSDMVGAIALQLNPNVTLGYQARWEEDFSRLNVQEAAIGLNFSKLLLNLRLCFLSLTSLLICSFSLFSG